MTAQGKTALIVVDLQEDFCPPVSTLYSYGGLQTQLTEDGVEWHPGCVWRP